MDRVEALATTERNATHAYVYGERREVRGAFGEFVDPARTAVISIDMHHGHLSDAHAIEGSRWTEFETRVEPADMVVATKKRLSVFHPTDLDFLLRNLGTHVAALNGGFTDCCVLNAAFDASNRDYRVVVLRDLVSGTNEEMENAPSRWSRCTWAS